MLLPNNCSAATAGKRCEQPPAFVISVSTPSGEYMLAVTCDQHRNAIESKLRHSQEQGNIPTGTLLIKPVTMVSTDCITGSNEDYVDIELNRGMDSERRIG